jgi:hypothetical protein
MPPRRNAASFVFTVAAKNVGRALAINQVVAVNQLSKDVNNKQINLRMGEFIC